MRSLPLPHRSIRSSSGPCTRAQTWSSRQAFSILLYRHQCPRPTTNKGTELLDFSLSPFFFLNPSFSTSSTESVIFGLHRISAEVQPLHGQTTCLTMTTMTVMPTTHRSCSICVTIASKARLTPRVALCPDQSEKYLKCVRRSSPSFSPLTPARSTIGLISITRGHNPRRHLLIPSPLTAIPGHMHQAAGLPVHRRLLPDNLQTLESVSRWMFRALLRRHPSWARTPLDPIPISRIRVLSIRGSSLQHRFSHRHHTNQDTFRGSPHTFRQLRFRVAQAVLYTSQHRFRPPRRQALARVLILCPCCHLMGRLDTHHGSHSPILVQAPMTCSRTCLDPRAEAG